MTPGVDQTEQHIGRPSLALLAMVVAFAACSEWPEAPG